MRHTQLVGPDVGRHDGLPNSERGLQQWMVSLIWQRAKGKLLLKGAEQSVAPERSKAKKACVECFRKQTNVPMRSKAPLVNKD